MERKYNVGDKFIVEIGKVTGYDGCPYEIKKNNGYEGKYGDWVIDDEFINAHFQPYEEQKITWRDGAVEQWESVCTLDKAGGFRWKAKNNPTGSIYWSADSDITDPEWWSRVLWLPASEFPMPAVPEPPEPVIEDCPLCSGNCKVGEGYVMREGVVFCMTTACEYRATNIDAHNTLCRRVK